MLSALMHPERWPNLDEATFSETCMRWMGDVQSYELQKKKPIDDEVKVKKIEHQKAAAAPLATDGV